MNYLLILNDSFTAIKFYISKNEIRIPVLPMNGTRTTLVTIAALVLILMASYKKPEISNNQTFIFGQYARYSATENAVDTQRQHQSFIQANPNTIALSYWKEATGTDQVKNKNAAVAKKYNNLAAVYMDRAYYQTAYHYLEQARKLLGDKPRSNEKQLLQTINLNKASILIESEAIGAANQILSQIAAEATDPDIRTIADYNLLRIHIHRQEKESFYALAASCMQQATKTSKPYANQLYSTILSGYLLFDDLAMANTILHKFSTQFRRQSNPATLYGVNGFLQYQQKTGLFILAPRDIALAIQLAGKAENYAELRDLHYLASAQAKSQGQLQLAFHHLQLADSFNNIQHGRLTKISKLDFAEPREILQDSVATGQNARGKAISAIQPTIKYLLLLSHLLCIITTVIILSRLQKRRPATPVTTAPLPAVTTEIDQDRSTFYKTNASPDISNHTPSLLRLRPVAQLLNNFPRRPAPRIQRPHLGTANQQILKIARETACAGSFPGDRDEQATMAEFIKTLQNKFPLLTPLEQQVCGYIYLGYHNKDIAKKLNKSLRSIESARFRARQKMGTDKFSNFQNTLHNL